MGLWVPPGANLGHVLLQLGPVWCAFVLSLLASLLVLLLHLFVFFIVLGSALHLWGQVGKCGVPDDATRGTDLHFSTHKVSLSPDPLTSS